MKQQGAQMGQDESLLAMSLIDVSNLIKEPTRYQLSGSSSGSRSRSLPIPMGFAAGTGMLVGPRLLLTNNHVLRSLSLAK